jgi:hypothetical protein
MAGGGITTGDLELVGSAKSPFTGTVSCQRLATVLGVSRDIGKEKPGKQTHCSPGLEVFLKYT